MTTKDDGLALDNASMDPTMQAGTLVSKDKDSYSDKSYQRLIQERTKTASQMIYDVVRDADFEGKRADAVDEAIMLGSWEFNAPGMNRLGRIEELEDDSEEAKMGIDGDRAREIDTQALEDARMPGAERPDDYDVWEGIYYGLRRNYHALKLEIARDRESGRAIRDYTDVKSRLAAGASVEDVIDDLPVQWRKVLVMSNISNARDGRQSTHIERLVANVAPSENGKVSSGGFMGKGRGGRGRRGNGGGSEDAW